MNPTNEKMEMTVIGRFSQQVWFVVLLSSALCFFLLSFNHSLFSGGSNGVTFFANNYANAINTHKPKHHLNGSFNRTADSSVPMTETSKGSSAGTNCTTTNEVPKVGSSSAESSLEDQNASAKLDVDSCSGRYIYVHDLPSRFNYDLLRKCQLLTRGTEANVSVHGKPRYWSCG